MRMQINRRFVLAALVAGLAYPACAETIREMFDRDGVERRAVSPEDAALLRVRRFERPARDAGQHPSFSPQERLAYTFFLDNAYTATVRRVSAGYGGAQVVECQSDDTSVSVISVYAPDGERHEARDMERARVYLAVSQPDGTLEAQEYDLTRQVRCTDEHLPIPAEAAEGMRPLPRIVPGGRTVDLMIVADASARSWANARGGGLATVASAAVARLNAALANSGLTCRVRLVRIYEPDYAYTGGIAALGSLLAMLQSSGGALSEVCNQRDLYGADVVTMFIDTGSALGVTGIGYEGVASNFAYSVCAVRSLNTAHTMSHEIGHNFGCGHSKSQRDEPGPGIYPYAAGWYFTGTDNKHYHTIMAYNYDGHASRIYTPCDYFSTPLAMHRGGVAGHEEDADNALCLSLMMATVADYRPSVAVCTVTLNAQGGTVASAWADALVGQPYGALPTPTRAGYLFSGWWTAPNGGGTQITADDEVPDIDSQTLYAYWQKSRVLTLREASVEGAADPINVLSGTVLTLRANDRTHQGLVFEKWTVNPANIALGAGFDPMAMTTEIVMPDRNLTLTATYIAAPGYIQVTVKPDAAQGIQWSRDSGKTWADAANDGTSYPVKSGACTLSFRSSHPDWLAPQKQTVNITALATNAVTAVALAPRLIGTFSGWLADGEERVCGTLNMTVGSNGKTTAKAVLTNGTFSLTAPAWSVDASDAFGIALAAKNGERLTLTFDASPPFSAFPVAVGVLTGGAFGADTSFALAQRNAFTQAKALDNAAARASLQPRTGYYTVLLGPDAVVDSGTAENKPDGFGYLGITINAKNGSAKTAGKLPNGMGLSLAPTVILADAGQLLIPCFSLLYSKRGFYSGILTLEDSRVTGDAFWLYPGRAPAGRPPQTEDRFALALAAQGGPYAPVTRTAARFVARAPFADADAPPVADVLFEVDGAGKARFPKTSDGLNNPQKASLSLTPKTGIFKGKLTLPLDGKNVSASHEGILAPDGSGALLGAGHYLVPDKKDGYSIRRPFTVRITTDD